MAPVSRTLGGRCFGSGRAFVALAIGVLMFAVSGCANETRREVDRREGTIRGRLRTCEKHRTEGQLEEAWELSSKALIDAKNLSTYAYFNLRPDSMSPGPDALVTEIIAFQDGLRVPVAEGRIACAKHEATSGVPADAEKTLATVSDVLKVRPASFIEAEMDVVRAYMKADRPVDAIRVFFEKIKPEVPDFHASTVTILRREILDGGIAAIRKRLAADSVEQVEEAVKLANILEERLPDQRDALKEVRLDVTSKRTATARWLAAQAGAFEDVEDYSKGEPLLRRAVSLDPTNSEYKKRLEVLLAFKRQRTPTYVKDVFGQKEGNNGFIVYYTLANDQGEFVAASGKVTLSVSVVGGGSVMEKLGHVEAQVKGEEFVVREVGLGAFARKKLMHVLPRMTLKNVDWIRSLLYHGCELRAHVEFTPDGGSAISGDGQIQIQASD